MSDDQGRASASDVVASEEIIKMLQSHKRTLNRYCQPSVVIGQEKSVPLNSYQTIPQPDVLDPQDSLDVEEISARHQRLADVMLNATLGDFYIHRRPAWQGAVKREAIREMMQRSLRNCLEEFMTPARDAENHQFLEQVFANCRTPNPAEVSFLAYILGSSEEAVRSWFSKANNETRALFVATEYIAESRSSRVRKIMEIHKPASTKKPLLAD